MRHSQTIRHLLWEKAPFILLTIVSSIITYWGQYKSELIGSEIPLFVRFQNAVVSYVFFLWKTVWPSDLAVWYPYEFTFPFWQYLFSFFILMGITVAVIYTFKKFPFLFVGWFWYLGTFVPMIGLVQLSNQARSDRFSYLPSIGIAIMLAWGIPHFFPREEIRKKILFPAAIAVLSILAAVTWHQCGYWKNSTELFNHCLQVTENNPHAHFYLGLALAEKGKSKEAIVQFNKGLSIMSIEFRILAARGDTYSVLGQYNLAIEDYNEVLRLRPNYAEIYYGRGKAYDALGQYQAAIGDFNEYIRRTPDAAKAYYSRGNVYSEINQYQPAIADYNEAIRLKPDNAEAYHNRGNAYFIQGNKLLGCSDAQKACELGNCKLLEWAKDKRSCR